MDRMEKTYIANFVLAVLLIPASFLHAWTGLGSPIGSKDMLVTDAVPYGLSFLIWWVIFVGVIYYASALLRMGKREFRHVAEHSAVAFGLCIVWAVVAQLSGVKLAWFSPLILIAAYVMALRAYFKAMQVLKKLKKKLYWQVTAPLGLFAGWLGLAFFINLSVVLESSGLPLLRLSPPDQSAVIIFCATGLSLLMIYKAKGELSYAAAVAWGLIGIFGAHFGTLAGDAALLSLLALVLGSSLVHYID